MFFKNSLLICSDSVIATIIRTTPASTLYPLEILASSISTFQRLPLFAGNVVLLLLHSVSSQSKSPAFKAQSLRDSTSRRHSKHLRLARHSAPPNPSDTEPSCNLRPVLKSSPHLVAKLRHTVPETLLEFAAYRFYHRISQEHTSEPAKLSGVICTAEFK
ncbi:hypothetical protein CLAIMM_03631 [Cladophialophora immunda]|nr:hypothetical protein CLAIMM_03631 [Cladophialophora immunda]